MAAEANQRADTCKDNRKDNRHDTRYDNRFDTRFDNRAADRASSRADGYANGAGKPGPGANGRNAPSAPVAATAEPQRRLLARRRGCMGAEFTAPPPRAEAAYAPLSRTTDRVLLMLLDGDLSRLRADRVAENLGISGTTLRRRLRNDHTSYQFLLDRARQYRCESQLRERWRPGKCMAEELGYLEINSFYRAFKRWTGLSYSEYKQLHL